MRTPSRQVCLMMLSGALAGRCYPPRPSLFTGIVKLRLTAVSDAQHGGFTTGLSLVSWGSVSSCPKTQTNSSSFVFLDTTSSGAPVGRNGWSAGEVCSGSPIAEPVPRRLVSASFENASRIRPCRSVRVFGQDGHGEYLRSISRRFAERRPRPVPKLGPFEIAYKSTA